MRKRFTSDDLVYYLGWFDKQWEDDIFTRFYDIVKAVRTED